MEVEAARLWLRAKSEPPPRHETGAAVAFTVGNLGPVSAVIPQKHPEAQLIVCADDDAGTPGNPGRFKARDAARAVDALLAVPLFGADRPADATDFNDLNQTRGIESVRDSISAATVVGGDDAGSGSAGVVPSGFTEWPEPEPLTEPLEALAYPVEALPRLLRDAVTEAQAFVQAPMALVACSALSGRLRFMHRAGRVTDHDFGRHFLAPHGFPVAQAGAEDRVTGGLALPGIGHRQKIKGNGADELVIAAYVGHALGSERKGGKGRARNERHRRPHESPCCGHCIEQQARQRFYRMRKRFKWLGQRLRLRSLRLREHLRVDGSTSFVPRGRFTFGAEP